MAGSGEWRPSPLLRRSAPLLRRPGHGTADRSPLAQSAPPRVASHRTDLKWLRPTVSDPARTDRNRPGGQQRLGSLETSTVLLPTGGGGRWNGGNSSAVKGCPERSRGRARVCRPRGCHKRCHRFPESHSGETSRAEVAQRFGNLHPVRGAARPVPHGSCLSCRQFVAAIAAGWRSRRRWLAVHPRPPPSRPSSFGGLPTGDYSCTGGRDCSRTGMAVSRRRRL